MYLRFTFYCVFIICLSLPQAFSQDNSGTGDHLSNSKRLPTVSPAGATKPFRFILGSRLELGGDEVAKVFFTNGESQSVRAGQGGSIFLGGHFRFKQLPNFMLRGTIGLKYVTTAADNVHIRLTRYPIEFTGHFFFTDKFRLGTGYAFHHEYETLLPRPPELNRMPSAGGPVIELAYGGIGLTYTIMKYQDPMSKSYSANAVGLNFNVELINKKR